MAKWKTVARVRRSKDKEGNIIADRYYLDVIDTLEKGTKVTLFPADHSRLEDLVASGKLSQEQADSIQESVVFELSVKTEENSQPKGNNRGGGRAKSNDGFDF